MKYLIWSLTLAVGLALPAGAQEAKPDGERMNLTCVEVPARAANVEPSGIAERETRMACRMVPEAEWASRVDTAVLGRQLTGLPTPPVDEDRMDEPDTSRTLTERQGITETVQDADDADAVAAARAGREARVTGAEPADRRPAADRLGLTCVNVPDPVLRNFPAARATETRIDCLAVPEAEWTSEVDTMVLGRQFTGLPTPDVEERKAEYPDSSVTLTQRQGITEARQPAADPDPIDPKRPGDESERTGEEPGETRTDAAAAEGRDVETTSRTPAVGAGVAVPLDMVCVSVDPAAAEGERVSCVILPDAPGTDVEPPRGE